MHATSWIPRPRCHRCHRGRPARCAGDGGQAGLLVALVVLALGVGAAALVATLGGAVAERTRARTAADAAALAGVTGGRPAAADVAQANGGVLERYEVDGTEVEATVVVGSTRATSRAAPEVRPRRPSATRITTLPPPAQFAAVTASSSSCSEPARPPDLGRRRGFP